MSGRERNYTSLLVGVIVTVAGLIGFGVLVLAERLAMATRPVTFR